MVSYKEIEKAIETKAPLSLQEDWDNSGWQVRLKTDFNRILLALEIRSDVIEEAVTKRCDLIITHHPLIFGALHQVVGLEGIDFSENDEIDNNNITSNMLIDLIQEGISVYSIHTPFDKCNDGNNDFLGAMLGLDSFMLSESGDGYVRVGEYNEAIGLSDIMDRASLQLGVDKRFFRYAGDEDVSIKRVCWVSGAGADYMVSAIVENCDLYVTGDLKYHDAQKAHELGINVLDLGHYATENIFRRALSSILMEAGVYDNAAVILSDVDINPFSI
ncbi:MAG: Nif3-like dinuclear metal center hexameric protein [Firmicutes bacterium]|nr:Nif3-like dinuclear metal center hexameric protein [Bacillota bacterium]